VSEISHASAHTASRTGRQPKPRPALAGPFIPARNETEAMLAKVWCEVLRLEEVGVADDFLDLGGDSIKMFRVLSQIETRYGLSIPLDLFFENLTVAGLAQILQESPGDIAENGSSP
jgi:acyl carrier protein